MAGNDKIMKILAIARYEEPVIQEINNSLEDMQRYVMGYIETVTLSDTAMLVCNEEGKLADFTPNRILKIGSSQDVIRGDFFICGWSGDEFCDISNEDVEKYTKMFSKPDVCDVLTALHRLEWLEIQNPDGRFCTINGILYSRNGKSLYFCPREREGSVRIQEGTEVICKNAFSVTNISELIIPDSVKRIQEFACGDNHVLEKVIGGKGIVSFGQYAFFNCVKLTELSLGKNIKLIGNAAFTNTGLKKVDLPEGLKTVGGGAFHTVHITEDNYMVGVEPEGMYEVHIPKSLKKIGCCAFANASVVYAENVNRKLLMACVQSGNMQRYHVARFWRLKVKDKPELILPKNIESPELAAQEINDFLNMDGGKIPHLYKYGQGNTTLAAALEHCRLYTDRQTKAFLTRHASEIADIYSDEAEEFAKYIHAGVFTNIALKKMFAELEVNKKERDDLQCRSILRV